MKTGQYCIYANESNETKILLGLEPNDDFIKFDRRGFYSIDKDKLETVSLFNNIIEENSFIDRMIVLCIRDRILGR